MSLLKHPILIILGSLLLSCSQEEASSSKEGSSGSMNPEVMADEAANTHLTAINSLKELLESPKGDLVEEVDDLYESYKSQLMAFSKKAMSLNQRDFELYSVSYQDKAFIKTDSAMFFIAKYKDSLISHDPGNVLSMELQSYLSIGIYASPEMMKRVVPSEYEKTYGSK